MIGVMGAAMAGAMLLMIIGEYECDRGDGSCNNLAVLLMMMSV